MAKRAKIDSQQAAGLFRKTEGEPEPQPREEKPEDPIKPRGIGLRQSEWALLEAIGKELGNKKAHALAAWAIRDFIKRYENDELDFETKRTLPGL